MSRRRRIRRWNGWDDERDSWQMCREMCHEVRGVCWYPAQRLWQLVRGTRAPRGVRRTVAFDMELIDIKASMALAVNDPNHEVSDDD